VEIHSQRQTGDLPHWLALVHAPGIGPVTYKRLLEQFGNPETVFDTRHYSHEDILPEPVMNYLRQPDWHAVEKDLAWLQQDGNHILTMHDPLYPPLLREIPDPPPILFVTGNVELLTSLQIAMVGSRNPSPMGIETAHEFAADLCRHGLTITSGLALGIDAAAHIGALDNDGTTLAVMGTGPDQVYPARHRQLAQKIAENGAMLTEFTIGTPPLAENFPRRNRIISGLCVGTLVVEAAQRSGSLITARMALDQGREVFAIPGSINNPLARGCHMLIRQGAKLVEDTRDILEELVPLSAAALSRHQPVKDPSGEKVVMDEQHSQVLDQMGYDPIYIDVLVERTGLTAEVLSSMLLVLELHNQVASVPGGSYIRLGKRN
jgi:DNA processing protein